MIVKMRSSHIIATGLMLPLALSVDDMGFKNGVVEFETKNWNIKIVNDSGTLASLRPAGTDFDFLAYDYMLQDMLLENGSYYWGDINIRHRESYTTNWTSSESAAARVPVTRLESAQLMAHDLSPTMMSGSLDITREWLDVDGDLGLQFTIHNTGNKTMELGSLGFAAAVNNIFTSKSASAIYQNCSLMDPYVGLDAGHLRVTPLDGTGAALVVVPLEDTQLEAYRRLDEESRSGTRYGGTGWEGLFEWQVYSKAYAENEWQNVDPWNPATSASLKPGQSRRWGIRFVLVENGIQQIDVAIRKTGTPTALSVPGYIVPRDTPAKLALQHKFEVRSMSVTPLGALEISAHGNKTYTIRPSPSAWGRVRLTISYEDGKLQTVHYYITKPASEAVSDLGRFLTNEQWFDDMSDPFGRAPSVMGYDGEVGAIVEQDLRLQPPGLSDEGGSGAYVSAAIKQVFQPNAEEISKLESFVDGVLYNVVQNEDYTVKRGVFYYEPTIFPDYPYSDDIDWTGRTTSKKSADEINRAYNYVWPAACYWALYRAGRAHPGILKAHNWEWYLNQAFKTVMRGMQPDIGFSDQGLMGETIFGEILTDFTREGKTCQAKQLTAVMRTRMDKWLTEEYPFGSELGWDSTGQEGVHYWSLFFGETDLALKTRNVVTGYTPTVPHWGYNGNARRYWDFGVTGKLAVVERQIHHYGSGLNALTMLAAYRDDPSNSYYLRVGYGGISGPLSNIHQNGWASCAMHSWPEHLFWDGYSGDYGPGFVGLALGSGTYLAEDAELGLVAYGGILSMLGPVATVQVRDPVRQMVFIASIGLEIKIDAGVIESFTYNVDTGAVSMKIGQLPGGLRAASCILWVSSARAPARKKTGSTFLVEGVQMGEERQGTKVSLKSEAVDVNIVKV